MWERRLWWEDVIWRQLRRSWNIREVHFSQNLCCCCFLLNLFHPIQRIRKHHKQKHMQFCYISRPGCSLYLLSFLVVIGISFAVLTQLSPQPSLGTFGYLKQAHPLWICVARILMLCWHESDWMSKRNFWCFVLSLSFRPKADVLTIKAIGHLHCKIARSCQWYKCFKKIDILITKVAVGQVDLPQAVSDAFFQKAWMQMLVGPPSKQNGRMLCLRNNTSWKSELKRTGCLEYITACHESMSHESNGN